MYSSSCSKHIKRSQKGFSLIELLVVMSLIGVFIALSSMSFVNYDNAQTLKNESKTMKMLLEKAYNASLTKQRIQQNGDNYVPHAYGVYFDTHTIPHKVLYYAKAQVNTSDYYESGDVILETHVLAKDVGIQNITKEDKITFITNEKDCSIGEENSNFIIQSSVHEPCNIQLSLAYLPETMTSSFWSYSSAVNTQHLYIDITQTKNGKGKKTLHMNKSTALIELF